jgi:non-lysosomal glucosylceramidase
MPRNCGCAGPCGQPNDDTDGDDGDLTRRNFIGLVGGAAGLIALTPGRLRAGVTPQNETDAAKALAEWKKELHETASPRRYFSDRHTDVRFPLGGIGTGNIELGADGQLTNWQLFNTLRDGNVPFVFAVCVGETAKLLQTTGGPPDWPRVARIEMTGEYPVAVLEYKDTDLPIQLSMTAFTPLSPLDSAFSSWPVACFIFRVHNLTATKQTVRLGGFLQNAIGYDALGPASRNKAAWDGQHPNFGFHQNRLREDKSAMVLEMRATTAPRPTLSHPVRLYTNGNIPALNLYPLERPAELTIAGLDAIQPPSGSERSLIWIENAALDISEATLIKIQDCVHEGAILVWSGDKSSVLEIAAQTDKTVAPDVLFEDFENGYGKWTATGTAFGTAPVTGTLPNQQAVAGFAGKGFVNSFLGGDDATGTLTSAPFTIERRFVRFLIGGGDHPRTQIRLMVDGKVVRAQSGKSNERLEPAVWDVQEWLGKTGQLVIVDEQKGPWGHINIDQIQFADLPFSPSVLALVRALRPGVLGKGKIVRTPQTFLSSDDSEIWTARQSALSGVCQLAGIDYRLPNGVPEGLPGAGTMALGTSTPGATGLESFTDWTTAWNWFSKDTAIPAPATAAAGRTVNGALSVSVDVAAGATVEVPFVLAWHYPNRYSVKQQAMGNHYTRSWKEASAVAQDALHQMTDLRTRTERFRSHFYDSTLPYWLLDAITSQISTIRHIGVVFRIGNGDIYGWEGSNGCCPPTCTHVWGYEQSLAYLFPDLEREMRRIDFEHQQRTDGGVNNRTEVPSPPRPSGEHPFADGHASTILKAYREARYHTDESLFRSYWPRVKNAVEYLLKEDAASSPNGKPDGTLSGDQWNTYDNAIHGVNSFIGSYYLAGLRAGEEMARRVGASADADRFRDVFESGQKKLIELCWNGEYFQQHLPGYENRAGEYGPGCLADQLIGQWWAHQLDLGYILPQKMVRTALRSLYRHNWLTDHSQFRHNWRKFAGGTDKGLLLCTWPNGGRPENTIPYVDEVWTGVEYQVAAHFLYEDMTDEALAIIKSVRDRYDGVPRAPMGRNPWSEIECGGHYARAMSSWSLLLALSGFSYDGPKAELRFIPRYRPEDFKSFFSGPEGWGSLRQTRQGDVQTVEITVAEGNLAIRELQIALVDAGAARNLKLKIDGKSVPMTLASHPSENRVHVLLDSRKSLALGSTLTVTAY